MKKKDQVSFDEQEDKRLQDEFDDEERLAREKNEANVALTEEWNDIQARIETDYELAQRLQAEEKEELTVNEKATLFQQLLKKRRKHFAAKRAEEKRNRPPTKAQQRSTEKEEGTKKAEAEVMEGSSKRVGDELEQEATKKQKINDDQETAELQSMMEVIPNEEEVAVDAIPLATKPPSIVDCKFIKDGKIGYYQIIRADGSSKRPKEGYERVLWGDLKKMFEHHIEDTVWRNLQGQKVLVWKLFNSCGGMIVGIKRLLDDLKVTAAKVRVTAAKKNLVLFSNLNEKYAKVNAASTKVTTAERLQLLEEFILTEKRSKTYQRKDKD
ncbi:hypothetical protein Tco_1152178 [Tanacetum coccineum]